jgi:thioester reductase-like protein
MPEPTLSDPYLIDSIAIIALAGRFPGADTVEDLWGNLRTGVESIRFFTDDELDAAGVPLTERRSPEYVPAKGVLADIAGFDAGFFGMSPREAALLDPQQRLFLEVCSELLERAAVVPGPGRDRIGVFAGVGKNTYLFFNLLSHPELRRSPAAMQTLVANDKDYVATRTSYKLGLRGPSLTVQSACSTSLVAVHLAGQSLLLGECDYAIAGGASVDVPHHSGYPSEPGGIFSPDGHCRAFDASARGTVFGQGAGVVLLRRLPDAIEAGDRIHAVIRGSAVNNDGAGKAGFTAPSVDGQAEVIARALAAAGVDPATVGYVEAHGTGTALGDPIEVEALTRVFQRSTDRTAYCRLGSVKTNVGHLNTAAGITGLIKAALAVQRGEIPPSLHFERPNPLIPFARTPFTVNTELCPWPAGGHPRRAGVSSFGIGGTNAHVVLEEAPEQASSSRTAGWQLIPVSAGTPRALAQARLRLAAALAGRPGVELADVAYTQQVGRRPLPYRFAVVAEHGAQAAELLAADPSGRAAPTPARERPSIAFLFPGQGSGYPGLARGLYRTERVFRDEFDACGERLRAVRAADPHELMDATGGAPVRTELVQPALFAVEYALARLWQSWGIEPDAVLGHSLGELVAACVAGVFERDDALLLVAERAARMGTRPPGAMLAVACSVDGLPDPLPDGVEVAALNSPAQTVLAGSPAAIRAAGDMLRGCGLAVRAVRASHAFHSSTMDSVAKAVGGTASGMTLGPPRIPCLSNVTGTWLRPEEAADPAYWGRQLREPVRFADCVGELLTEPGRVLLELGPAGALGRFASRHPRWAAGHVVLGSLPVSPEGGRADQEVALGAVATLWTLGAAPRWPALHEGTRRRPVVLPTYPFERVRAWIDPAPERPDAGVAVGEVQERFAAPQTRPAPAVAESEPGSAVADSEPGSAVAKRVARVFEAVLGVSGVSADDEFFELGGDSLLGVELVSRLQATLGVPLQLGEVFENAVPRAIAALTERSRANGRAVPPAAARTPGVADAWFDAAPSRPARALPAGPASVLLTGATGFLGAFLLAELLDRTAARVACLVRCPQPAAGRDRLAAVLRRYGLDGVDLARIEVVPGDLSAPRFGLSAADYDALAARVDAVYHSGARVSFLEPYRLIRRTNVDGTREVLRFACAGAAKLVHHVSSIAALDCDAFADVGFVAEDHDLSAGAGFYGGYDESKWVAERIAALARERGLPVSVYRPGNIAGHAVTGAVSTAHLVSAMLRGCLLLGLAPDVDSYVDVVPVDYVSRALVHLSLSGSAHGRTYHLVNPTPVRWQEIVGQLRELGYPLRLVGMAEWQEAIRSDRRPDNPLRVFLPMLQERPLFSGRRFGAERTLDGLAGSGIACPPLQGALLASYVRHLVGAATSHARSGSPFPPPR